MVDSGTCCEQKNSGCVYTSLIVEGRPVKELKRGVLNV